MNELAEFRARGAAPAPIGTRGAAARWANVRAAVVVLAAVMTAALAGCGIMPSMKPYRMEIQQGNYVTQDMLSRLAVGMTRDQVRFALGTPLVVDAFRDDRWEYIFLRYPENTKVPERRRISVFFENDKLRRVDGDVVISLPQAPAPEAAAPSAAPMAQNAPAAPAAAPPAN
jgi:outer membrane protein assembly factor BamE